MIFKIDSSIRTNSTKDTNLLLANALCAACEHGHYVDMEFQVHRWIVDTILDSGDYMGRLQSETFKNNLEFWLPNEQQKRDLKYVYVGGSDEKSVTLSEMYYLADKMSWVVLENATYDGATIRRWVELLHNRKQFGSTYDAVYDAINNGLLDLYHAGGGDGTISNAIRELKRQNPQIKRVYRWKTTTIFDSDKKSSKDTEEHNASLIRFLNEEHIDFHELVCREIENYFLPQTYEQAKMEVKKEDILAGLNKETWKYVDLAEIYEMEKSDVANKLCPNLTYLMLTEDEYSQIEEIKQVILHMAKYI